jgi:integrase
MQAKINASLLKSEKVKPQAKPFEIYDTELKGFTLRIQPNWVDKSGTTREGAKTYLIRYRLLNGKQNRAVIGRVTDYSPTQARDKADKIRRGVKDGVDPKKGPVSPESTHTLQSFFDNHFKPWAEAHHKDSKATLTHFERFSQYAEVPLDQFNGLMFEEWKTARLKAGIKPSTINRNLSMIRSLFSRAVEWDKITGHPMTKVKSLKVDSIGVVRFLSDDENLRLMKALDVREERIRLERDSANQWRKARGYALHSDLRKVTFADHLKPMVVLSLNTGVRWGELTRLLWTNIDLKKKLLTVVGETAKSGSTRHLPLNSVAVAILKKWKKQQTVEALIFHNKDGNKFDNLDKSWKAILKAAKVTSFRWHDLRHTFASNLVMAGVDLNTVRELMGHSDIKMTLRYAHLAPEHKASAVNKLVKKLYSLI